MADIMTSWNPTNNTSGAEHGQSGAAPSRQMNTKEIVKMVSFGILAMLIVFANLLMIGAFHVNRRLRTRTNLLLMSLAVADMLIGSISMPLWVYIYITSAYNGSVHKMYVMFDVICGVSSILNMTAISLERYYALRSPIKHRNIRKSMPQSFSISTPFFFDKLIHPLFSVFKTITNKHPLSLVTESWLLS